MCVCLHIYIYIKLDGAWGCMVPKAGTSSSLSCQRSGTSDVLLFRLPLASRQRGRVTTQEPALMKTTWISKVPITRAPRQYYWVHRQLLKVLLEIKIETPLFIGNSDTYFGHPDESPGPYELQTPCPESRAHKPNDGCLGFSDESHGACLHVCSSCRWRVQVKVKQTQFPEPCRIWVIRVQCVDSRIGDSWAVRGASLP